MRGGRETNKTALKHTGKGWTPEIVPTRGMLYRIRAALACLRSDAVAEMAIAEVEQSTVVKRACIGQGGWAITANGDRGMALIYHNQIDCDRIKDFRGVVRRRRGVLIEGSA